MGPGAVRDGEIDAFIKKFQTEFEVSAAAEVNRLIEEIAAG